MFRSAIAAQFAILAALLQQRFLAGSLINVATRVLVLAVSNSHVRAAGRAALRGATNELIRHIRSTYKIH